MMSGSYSSLSMSTPNLTTDLEIEDKLAQMEKMIKEQTDIINQQKNLITEQKDKLEIFQNTKQEENKTIGGLMEDID